jgi:alpha-beta hydrolase superfamily lysophospholipase
MEHKTGSFQGMGGIELFYQCWLPEGEVRCVMVLQHGFGEHSGRYAHMAENLAGRGIAVWAYDHRGHGSSTGQRGHINDWAEYREDGHKFVQLVHDKNPGLPVFLFGHSMGALTALDYALHYPQELSGVMACAASFETAGATAAYKILLAKLLSRLAPSFSMQLGLVVNALSSLPGVTEAYTSDPLVHGTCSVRWGTEMMHTITWLKEHAPEVKLPILLIHGEVDQICQPVGTRNFFADVIYPDKKLLIYPQSFHEVHNDLHQEQYFADLADWMFAHLGS